MITFEDYNAVCREKGVFFAHSGMRLTALRPGLCEAECTLESYHRNPRGTTHGGVYFTLMDAAGGCAAAATEEGMRLLVTQNAAIYYLRPALDGVLHIVAKAVKTGRTTGLVRAEIFNHEKLVATGELSVFYTGKIAKIAEEYFDS